MIDETFDRLARAFVATARALAGPGIASGEGPGLRYAGIGGPIPGFNRLMATTMDEATADADIDRALDRLAAFPVLSAWVPVTALPMDLVARLAARGFAADDEETVPAMRADLGQLPPLEELGGSSWRHVTESADIERVTAVTLAGFGMPASLDRFIRAPVARIVNGAGGNAWQVLAEIDGQPASVALVSVIESTAALYTVATVPDLRGRGLGRLVTLAALHEARSRGASVAVLESTAEGYRVYQRIGFRETGRYRVLVRTGSAAR